MQARARGAGRPDPFGEVRARPDDLPGPLDRSGDGASTGADTGPRPPRALLFAITITGVMANTLVAPALPDIRDEFGLGSGSAGLVVSAAALPGVVVAPLIGLLADRYGRRAVVVPCLVAFGVFGVLAGFAPTYPLLLACRLAQGVGAAGLINLAVVLISDHWSGRERAAVIGQNVAALTISIALLPPLGGLLADLGGWRLTFAPYGIGLVTAVAAAVVLPRSERRDVSYGALVRGATAALSSVRVVATIASGFATFALVFGLVLTALPEYLEAEFSVGAAGRGGLLSIAAVGSTLVALRIGPLTTRLGSRRLVLAGTGLFAAAFLVAGVAPSLVVVAVGIALYGLAEGLSVPTLQNLVAGAAPGESRGAVLAVWTSGVRAGQSLGPVLAGASVAAFGPATTFLIGAGVAVAILLAQVVSGQPSGEAATAH